MANNTTGARQGGTTKKALFKTEEFLRLLGKSGAAGKMNPADYYVLFNLSFETSNENVKKIFDALVEEEKRMAHVEEVYADLVKKAISDFETGVMDLKIKAKKEQIESLQKEKLEKEQTSADALLKQIK